MKDQTHRALRHWQEIDARLNAGEFSGEETARVAIEAGLARRVLGPGLSLREVWVIEPDRGPNLVPGPILLIGFEGRAYGGPRLYRPVSDQLRPDTGAFG
jgi:hypothetical protein